MNNQIITVEPNGSFNELYSFNAKVFNQNDQINVWTDIDYTELNDFMISKELLVDLEDWNNYRADLLTQNLIFYTDSKEQTDWQLKQIQIHKFNTVLIRSHRNYITLTDILTRIKGE